MSERIHALAQLLLGKPSVEDCTLEELQHLAQRYPYFAPAQFLLLQKLKSTGSPGFEKQQQKAVLYYHDPLQFDYFISSDKFFVDEKTVLAPLREASLPTVTEAGHLNSPDNLNSEEQSLLRQEALTISHTESDAVLVTEETKTELEKAPAATEEITITGDLVRPKAAGIEDAVPEQQPESSRVEPTIASTAVKTEPALLEDEAVANKTSVVEHIDQETTTKNDNRSRDELKGINIAPTAAASQADMLFEPFHTVDYFASQGIKITADELPKDKLSKQLRSFTEWLKIMKRLPATEMAQAPQSTAEKSVEHLASHSVEGGEVVTEAMAEVWAKQGANGKAIETYNKLSLLNPSKKAYFAAKIENLKGS